MCQLLTQSGVALGRELLLFSCLFSKKSRTNTIVTQRGIHQPLHCHKENL